jgi:rRNA processing/ribosome biogenesis
LKRPEASVLLERAMATLTCVFGLISTHPALSRELNTMLPVFFTALLNSTCQKSLLEPALKALHALIPEHATTFRPNLGKVNQLTLSILEGEYTQDNQKLAAKVYVDLHHSAQKGTGREHWRSCLLGTISEIHSILDRLFEVVEEGMSC